MHRPLFSAVLLLFSAAPFVRAGAPVFTPQVIDDGIQIGYGLAAGDVDGDGKTDLLLADKTEIVWYRNPDWQKHVMARRLTLQDNVCLAARDIDGDGKVEVAVGAQWNPGETSDEAKSGAVFYLQRPENPETLWTPVALPHEPTVHRMKWVRLAGNDYRLVVLPLHGRGNNPATGEGKPVRVLAWQRPADPADAAAWKSTLVDESMHKTHNFEILPGTADGPESLWIGGREGARHLTWKDGTWQGESLAFPGLETGVGEIRGNAGLLAAIQPMHGPVLAVTETATGTRTVLDDTMNQGHALICQPLLGGTAPQIAAGWREKNKDGHTGIRLHVRTEAGTWTTHEIDRGTMACEDLIAADLDADGRPDLIAAGRATHNVMIYWNRTDR